MDRGNQNRTNSQPKSQGPNPPPDRLPAGTVAQITRFRGERGGEPCGEQYHRQWLASQAQSSQDLIRAGVPERGSPAGQNLSAEGRSSSHRGKMAGSGVRQGGRARSTQDGKPPWTSADLFYPGWARRAG